MKTFIVDLWATIFSGLRSISIFHWMRKIFYPTRDNYVFTETWVLANLGLVIALLFLFQQLTGTVVMTILLIYAAIRIFEIFIGQVNEVLFDAYRAKKGRQPHAVPGIGRFVVLLLHNYVEIMLWYGLLYMNFNGSFFHGSEKLNTAVQVLGMSFNTMTTYGYANTFPIDRIGSTMIFSQSVIGLLMTLILLARFISIITPAASRDEL